MWACPTLDCGSLLPLSCPQPAVDFRNSPSPHCHKSQKQISLTQPGKRMESTSRLNFMGCLNSEVMLIRCRQRNVGQRNEGCFLSECHSGQSSILDKTPPLYRLRQLVLGRRNRNTPKGSVHASLGFSSFVESSLLACTREKSIIRVVLKINFRLEDSIVGAAISRSPVILDCCTATWRSPLQF